VELNVTFYRLPQESTFMGWYKRVPEDFLFVIKGSCFITHIKKLRDCEEPLETFLNHAQHLKEKLGIILWQLPPGTQINIERLTRFCTLLSRFKVSRQVRHVFEFRHKSWYCEETYHLLRECKFSLCIAHSSRWPQVKVSTADFIYLRFHGGEVLYGSDYSEEELQRWASEAKHYLKEGKDIFAYFNNDAYGFAVKNALRFKELVKE
jgi:uncharacterized protein YecE (DUF72 family)